MALMSESASNRDNPLFITVDKRSVRCVPGATAKKVTNQVTSRGFAFQADALAAAYLYKRGRHNGRM